MDALTNTRTSAIVPPEWLATLREVAARIDLGYEPVAVRGWMEGIPFLAAVRLLGGDAHPVEPFHHWTLRRFGGLHPAPGLHLTPEYDAGGTSVADYQGVMEVRLDDLRFLALRMEIQPHLSVVERAMVLGVPSVETGLDVARKVKDAWTRIVTREPSVHGAQVPMARRQDVPEADLVLPEGFKAELLGYLDGFSKSAEVCRQLRIAPNRGVLLVGRPGTGKTMVIRHLMGRYPHMRRLVYVNDPTSASGDNGSSFRGLLNELGRSEVPAMVVIEDIDRLYESGTVTPELFLNVLDGLLEPSAPTLWIATSNDPSGLEDNLLDRPGRFDRVFVFPMPGLSERVRIVERYSPWPVPEVVARQVASATEELSAAHIREICVAAALGCGGTQDRYVEHLHRELDRVREQHHMSRRYQALVQREGRVGFGG